MENLGRCVKVYRTIDGFLEATSHRTIDTLEKDVICDAIIEAITPCAREIAAERASAANHSRKYELGDADKLTIKGYATPKPSVVAITFGVSFDLQIFDDAGSEERLVSSILRLDGSCSYNPSRHETSDVIISRWSQSLRGNTGYGWSSYGQLDPEFQNQLRETRYI